MPTKFRVKRIGRLYLRVLAIILLLIPGWLGMNKFFEIRTLVFAIPGVSLDINKEKLSGNLLFFPSEKVAQILSKEYPGLKEIKIKKKFPNTLILSATLRQPLVKLTSGNRVYFLDGEAFVLPPPGQTEVYPLLLFELPSDYTVGAQVVDHRVNQSLAFLRIVNDMLPIDSIRTADELSLLAKSGKTEIFFPQKDKLALQATTLQTLLEGFRIKGMLPAKIDLRFSKPNVTF